MSSLSTVLFPSALAALIFAACPGVLHGGVPEWWSEDVAGGPPVLNPSAAENNKGVATVGQGKWMAQNALAALERSLGYESPVVGAIKADLYKMTEDDPHGVFFPFRPQNPTPAWSAQQRAPLQIGALKALAAPFYKHLSRYDPAWIEKQFLENGLSTEGKDYFPDPGAPTPRFFPWNPADDRNPEKNRAPAVIGQLKAVFSLRFENLHPLPQRERGPA